MFVRTLNKVASEKQLDLCPDGAECLPFRSAIGSALTKTIGNSTRRKAASHPARLVPSLSYVQRVSFHASKQT
ncbi:hypothetical protein GCM10023189_33240 [Nibrella saemangeumensis]|uniref:Uncharacterized protein n=1 Tax=Nibrella saemangeumensis TaxID=1084526 RepID=A0ABP8N3L5_9BACT